MNKLSTLLLTTGVGLTSALSQAQSYSASYTFNLNIGSPVYDIMAYESGPSWGGESWAYGATGNGQTTISPFFPTNLQPTSTLLLGLVDNLQGDGGTIADPVTHVVLFMDDTAATDAANIAWGTLFPNTDEDQLISNIELATSGQSWATITPGLDAVGDFTGGDATTGILNPDGTSQSAWFATGGDFTIETWTNGQILGYGTSQVLVTPEPAPFAALGLGCLVFLRRRRR
jgi:hypothetical protein